MTAVMLPLLVSLSVFVSSSKYGGAILDEEPNIPGFMKMFNSILVFGGTLLVLPVMLLRCCLLNDLPCWAKGHRSFFMWLPRGWGFGPLFEFCVVSMSRLILFKLMHPYHGTFSDHVLLVMSMVFLLCLELGFGHVALQEGKRAGLAVLIPCWILLLLLFCDIWNTAKFYHTPGAVRNAYLLGTLLYLPVAVHWLYLLISSNSKVQEPANELEIGLINQAGNDTPLLNPPEVLQEKAPLSRPASEMNLQLRVDSRTGSSTVLQQNSAYKDSTDFCCFSGESGKGPRQKCCSVM